MHNHKAAKPSNMLGERPIVLMTLSAVFSPLHDKVTTGDTGGDMVTMGDGCASVRSMCCLLTMLAEL
jgi:hypothetical protein